MDDELDERAVGTGTPVIAMVHMPASPGDPGLITARCCEIIERKKRFNTNLPIFSALYEPYAVLPGVRLIEAIVGESIHEAFADGLFLSGKNAMESIEKVERASFVGTLRWDLCGKVGQKWFPKDSGRP